MYLLQFTLQLVVSAFLSFDLFKKLFFLQKPPMCTYDEAIGADVGYIFDGIFMEIFLLTNASRTLT